MLTMFGSTAVPAFAAPQPSNNTSKAATTPPDPSYTFDVATGNWVNGLYTWNPKTGITSPVSPGDYSYNNLTGRWDSNLYVYNPDTNTYVLKSSIKPKIIVPSTQAVVPAAGPSSSSTGTGQVTNDGFFSGYNNATVNNGINSNATTGNSSVTGNTTAGNATTGNAQSTAGVINLLQSSSGLNGSGLSTFVANLNGSVNGDLLINPSSLNNVNNTVANNITINNGNNNTLNNNIVLNAQSGNANVDSNTTGGNATTGSATAVADVVNLINSAINSSQSFIGEINIYGDLTGNILLPEILNTNVGSNNTNSTNISNSLIANNTDTTAINNNILSNAQSGTAAVGNNTTAGSATTGAANTNVTLLNLTGKQVVAANSLLVFVNVLGKWVGLIMNAPSGSTSALLASGVNQNVTNNLSNTATLNNTTLDTINNNIKVNAKSGDAAVTNNTTAGNATSGNATTDVSLANLTNSNLNLSGWFGILFINVYGQWNGSLGSALDFANSASTTGDPSNTLSSTNPANPIMNYLPKTSSNVKTSFVNTSNSTQPGSSGSSSVNLASFINHSHLSNVGNDLITVPSSIKSTSKNNMIEISIVTLALASLIGAQIVARRHRNSI